MRMRVKLYAATSQHKHLVYARQGGVDLFSLPKVTVGKLALAWG